MNTDVQPWIGRGPIIPVIVIDDASLAVDLARALVADPALVLGPVMAHFGWGWDDWDRLAFGTAAGHLLECGAQVTGGYFADPDGFLWEVCFNPFFPLDENGFVRLPE